MIRTAILIDGGHLRVLAKKGNQPYTPDYVEKVALACPAKGEVVYRVLYYDCPYYSGKTKLPVSGAPHEFKGSDNWLRQMAAKDLFAVRRGQLKFRGWKPKSIPVSAQGLTDADFSPDFEQKGVDMRIGLDIANFCETKAATRIVLITNDTDFIPAMKYGRIAGLQVVLVTFPGASVASELLSHADFKREIQWPTP
ncbi:MAG: NYN domain-containing protein [Hyphomicrobium sp.]